MLLILHFQRAEVDRHFGVCPNRTLSLSCPYTSGKFVDETDVVSVESLYWFYFKMYVLFNSVHPHACPLWSLPLHGSGFTEWHPGILQKNTYIYFFFSIFFFMETIIYMPIYMKRKWCIDEKSDTSRKQE